LIYISRLTTDIGAVKAALAGGATLIVQVSAECTDPENVHLYFTGANTAICQILLVLSIFP
jgi:hypothetical protein